MATRKQRTTATREPGELPVNKAGAGTPTVDEITGIAQAVAVVEASPQTEEG